MVGSGDPDGDGSWFGEIDISNLGIVYAKLRNPLVIIKIQVELIGATLISTFSHQTELWPPYRISNESCFQVRYRQKLPFKWNHGGNVPSVDDCQMVDEAIVSFEHLHPNMSAPYALDRPCTGGKIMRFEVQDSAGGPWFGADVNLDDVAAKPKTITIQHAVTGLGNPLAEGFLMMKRDQQEGWDRVYCILKADVMFVFNDETRSHLVNIVNLSRHISTSHPSGSALHLASVFKYVERSWALFDSISSTIAYYGGSSSGAVGARSNNIDMNRVRILLLRLAEILQAISIAQIPVSTRPKGHWDEIEKAFIDVKGKEHQFESTTATYVNFKTQECVEHLIGAVEISGHEIASVDNSQQARKNDKHSNGDLACFRSEEVEEDAECRPVVNRRLSVYRQSEIRGTPQMIETATLRGQLHKGLLVDDLLEKAAAGTFSALEIVTALVAVGEAEDHAAAQELYKQLVVQGIFRNAHDDDDHDAMLDVANISVNVNVGGRKVFDASKIQSQRIDAGSTSKAPDDDFNRYR